MASILKSRSLKCRAPELIELYKIASLPAVWFGRFVLLYVCVCLCTSPFPYQLIQFIYFVLCVCMGYYLFCVPLRCIQYAHLFPVTHPTWGDILKL